MNHKNTVKKLERLEACDEAMDWVRENGGDMATLWEQCPRAEWMAWYIGEHPRLLKKTTLVKAALEVAKKILKKTADDKTNADLYKGIIKEVSDFIKDGEGNRHDRLELNDLYRRVHWNCESDGDRQDMFRELIETVTIPRGTYAFFMYAALTEGEGDQRKTEKARARHASTLRKYFEVGERGLQVKE